MSDVILEVEDVFLRFGGLVVLDGISFEVPRGGVLAIIGPNGAGKTSLYNVFTRVYEPQRGAVRLHRDGEVHDLLALRPHALARLGVARTFQNLQLIPHESAAENVVAGRHTLFRTTVLEDMLGIGRSRSQGREHRAAADEALELLDLGRFADAEVSLLPYGMQKRVEMARAIAMESQLLLLDEPAAGLNAAETDEIAAAMRSIKVAGRCTQVLIDHDMRFVTGIADYVVVLDFGRILAAGTPAEIAAHPEVISAYLGAPLEGLSQ